MRLYVLLVVVASLLGCQRPSDATRIVLTGSSTIAPLAGELGRAFEAAHAGVRIDVQTGGSSRGIADARDGAADIGMVSRALGEADADLVGHTIARDGIAIVVHDTNPIAALTTEQIRAIFSGDEDSWDRFGGPNTEITVLNKAEGRSTLEVFLHHVDLQNSQIAADVVVGDNEQAIKTVAGNPHAIGYVSIGTAEFDAAEGVAIKIVSLDGIEASTSTVKSGAYPLARPLNLVTKSAPQGLVSEFINFAQSAEADGIIRAQYFVPIAR